MELIDYMFDRQRQLTETALYQYYMISSCMENEVHTPFAYYIERERYQQMTDYAAVLNQLVLRILNQACETHESPFVMGGFPGKEEVLALSCPCLPFFWVRYDAFIRADGSGIFFSEFNYDKPCAQREILLSDYLSPHHNPNAAFRQSFLSNFHALCEPFLKKKETVGVAFLVSSAHEEEKLLSYLFMEMQLDRRINLHIVDTDNLYVEDGELRAFGQSISVVFRLYPTEYLHTIPDYKQILQLHNEGKILLVNDPRAIVGQSKALFAYLWRLAEENSGFLTDTEKHVIRESIPPTYLFPEFDKQTLRADKDKYVIKAAFGRYSEQVYIGRMYSEEDWAKIIDEVGQCEELHIVQQFCPIRGENVLRFCQDRYVYDKAYGNFGIYLSNDRVCGSCIRWSNDYLSSDDTVWVSPIGVNDRHLVLADMAQGGDRREMWQSVYDEAAFRYGFSGGYTGRWQSFSLQSVQLTQSLFDEIKNAAESLARLMDKTTEYVQANGELLYDVLGIPQSLQAVVSKSCGHHNFIGRFDFALDSIGRLKLLEFNAETPAGIIDAAVLNDLILQAGKATNCLNPNTMLPDRIKAQFQAILASCEKKRPIRTIAFVSLSYPEDYDNTRFLFDQLSALPYRFLFGEVSGLHVKNGTLYLYDDAVDAVYRYYPLDWFAGDPYFYGVTDAFLEAAVSINPPSSFIAQSKAILALMWELMKTGFYTQAEKETIQAYIPFTSLDASDFPDSDYCFKPYYSREGDGVGLSILGQKPDSDQNAVYQQRVDIRPLHLDVYSSNGSCRTLLYPIIGAFVAGETFAGIYTRGGDVITDQNAVYLPTFVQK